MFFADCVRGRVVVSMVSRVSRVSRSSRVSLDYLDNLDTLDNLRRIAETVLTAYAFSIVNAIEPLTVRAR